MRMLRPAPRALATIVVTAIVCATMTAPAQSQAPAGPAAGALVDAQRQLKATRLFEFLQKEYGLLLAKRKDRVSRAVLVVSLSRIPTPQVTKTLLDMAKAESDPLVRATAWDALFARAPMLSPDDYTRWMALTAQLLDAGVIRGDLRVAALELLAVSPPDARSKAMFSRLFALTDSRRPEDDPVIDALGRCVATWRSRDLVEALLNRLDVLDDAWRADRVLHAAGCPLGPEHNRYDLGSREALKIAATARADWWRAERPKWKEVRVDLATAPWRKLRPHLVPAPPAAETVDPDDKSWRRDLELQPPNLKSFDVGLVVDATGSMGPALAWLRGDVGRLMSGIGLVCLEPRIGLTFYRDRGDEFVTRHVPLTDRLNVLTGALDAMQAKGGGDEEEAILDALTECATKNPWAQRADGRRVIVLVGDAPPHQATQKECEAMLAAGAKSAGLRAYVVKLKGPFAAADQSALDALAKAGNGAVLEASAAELLAVRPRPWPWYVYYPFTLENGDAPPVTIDPRTVKRDGPPTGRRLLTAMLVDAINPQFADRVEPMTAVLWELLHEPTIEKQQMFGPAVTDMSRKPPPKGVQDR